MAKKNQKVDPRIAAYVTTSTDELIEDDKKFGKGKRIPRIKIEAGSKRNLRLLKAPTQTKFYIVRKQHWNVPYGMGKVPPQICSWAHDQEPCFYCAQTNEYYNSGDPRMTKMARQIKASTTYISNVLDLDDPLNEDGSPKVQIWQYSPTVFRELKGYFQDKEYGDLAHPLTGRDIRVKSEIVGEQGGNTWTKYSLTLRAKETPLEHLDALDNLYELADEYPVRVYPYQIQQGIFNGTLDPRSGQPKALLAGSATAGQLSPGDDDEEFESSKSKQEAEADVDIDAEAEKLDVKSEPTSDDEDDGWGDEDEVDASDDPKVADLKAKLKAAMNKKD